MTTMIQGLAPEAAANTMAAQYKRLHEAGPKMICIVGGASSVTHSDFMMTRYEDGSVLAWTRHDGFFVMPYVPWASWQAAEHALWCMGRFTAAERAAMVNHTDKWVDGVHWAADGSLIEF